MTRYGHCQRWIINGTEDQNLDIIIEKNINKPDRKTKSTLKNYIQIYVTWRLYTHIVEVKQQWLHRETK